MVFLVVLNMFCIGLNLFQIQLPIILLLCFFLHLLILTLVKPELIREHHVQPDGLVWIMHGSNSIYAQFRVHMSNDSQCSFQWYYPLECQSLLSVYPVISS